jgi:hypothetical protein
VLFRKTCRSSYAGMEHPKRQPKRRRLLVTTHQRIFLAED